MTETQQVAVVDEYPQFDMLPNGKKHVSFSELSDWYDCSFRHKLRFVDKLPVEDLSPILDFGTSVHAACENYLQTRVMDVSVAEKALISFFEEKKGHEKFTDKILKEMLDQSKKVLEGLPAFMDENFPNWELVEAEHFLYEQIGKHSHAFKGFVDAIIKTVDKKGKTVYWIIDWKTTSWGWAREKKTDFKFHQQLIFYKNFLCKKLNIPEKSVKCAFVLLKRTAKAGAAVELVKISMGPVTSERALKNLNNMISSMKKGIALKNKSECKYCHFKDTQYCT